MQIKAIATDLSQTKFAELFPASLGVSDVAIFRLLNLIDEIQNKYVF